MLTNRCVRVAMTGCLAAFTLGCADSKTGRPFSQGNVASAAEPDVGVPKYLLLEAGGLMDAESENVFEKMRPSLLPHVSAEVLKLDKGVTFISVPLHVLEVATPEDVRRNGLESLASGPFLRVFPIVNTQKETEPVVASIICSWNTKERKPVAKVSGEDEKYNERNTFTKQIEEARRIDLKEHRNDTQYDAYKGVMFRGINRRFLYVDRNERQEMIPLEVDRTYEFSPGKAAPIEEVIGKLKKMVEETAERNAPG